MGERRLDHRLAIVLFYAPPQCELEPKVSEVLLGFNFHFLLFAMALTGTCVVAFLEPTEQEFDPIYGTMGIILWAAIWFGILEVFYWFAWNLLMELST